MAPSVLQEFEFGLTTLFVMHSPDFVNERKIQHEHSPAASAVKPAIKANFANREDLLRIGERYVGGLLHPRAQSTTPSISAHSLRTYFMIGCIEYSGRSGVTIGMHVVAIHHIHDPVGFQKAEAEALKNEPPPSNSRSAPRLPDHSPGICIWQGPSVEEVQKLVDWGVASTAQTITSK